MGDNIAKTFKSFGTLQGKQSDNLPNESDIRSSVFSTPGDGNFDTMDTNTIPIERKNITSLCSENSSEEVEFK